MNRFRQLLVVLLVAWLVACSEFDSEKSPLTQWAADAATATSVGAAGECHLDDWAGRLFLLTADATVYAPGYTHDRFCSLRVGMPQADVVELLGQPLSEVWEFSSPSNAASYAMVTFKPGEATYFWPEEAVHRGMSASEVLRLKGRPREVTLNYSSRNQDTHYRQRSVHVIGGRVSNIRAGIYVD